VKTNVLSSAFIPVSAIKNFVRGTLHIVILFSMAASAAAPFAERCAARDEPLHEAIASLAADVLAVRSVRSPLRLDWRNESSLSAAESEALQSQFSSELASVSSLLSDEPSAQPLRVTLRDTATQLVIVARVPSADGEQIRLVQVGRATFTAHSAQQVAPSLQKQLLWTQREPIFDAVEHPVGDTKLLLVLGRETLWAYATAQTQLELRAVGHIPGPIHPSRALAGRIHFPKSEDTHFLLELPGKVCNGTLSEKLSIECPSAGNLKHVPAVAAAVKLLAPCDYSAWTLSSDDGDWSKPDRLFLHDTRSAALQRVVALEAPGPVLALSEASDSASSTAVIWNLSTGEYEIYRFSLACHN
jgi:hypothetical protein